MKNKFILRLTCIICLMMWSISCEESFLDVDPPGSYSEPSLQNLDGVEGMLIAAYSGLDGSWFESWGNNHFNQAGGSSNWIWGAVVSDDSYKGTELNDFADINGAERFTIQPSNPILGNKWNAMYDGIGKANAVLKNLNVIREDIPQSTADRIEGEARALRAHYHFEVLKVFGVPAYVDETVTDYVSVKNDQDIWPQIEADFQFAYDNLPAVQTAPGRINKWAAGGMLGKVHVYQSDWSAAEPILDDVIANGVTPTGAPYALMPNFYDNFTTEMENANSEMMFAYEASVEDGSISNGNYGNTLNQPHGGGALTGCCGFFQPSQNLVNSFKTDASGLPMPDTYNDTDVPSDEGLAAGDSFTPYSGNLDPRLDWTVGRRGIPFLDWGINPGSVAGGWVRNTPNGGPYNPMKNVPMSSDYENGLADNIDWGFVSQAKNVIIMRFADVLLLQAEVKAELNKLDEATTLVNRVRQRSFDDPATDFVKMPDGTDAANYVSGLYSNFSSEQEALKAIRFERKLELAMEGHRYFDLVRWHLSDNTKLPFDIVPYMNNYLTVEGAKRPHLSGATFSEKYIYMPIPEQVVTQSIVNGEANIKQRSAFQ